MIRVAIIADDHFDCSAGGRLDECVRLHDWIANDIEHRGVDAILDAGDLFERKSLPEDRNAAERWISRCAEIAPFVIVRGNHDVPGDLAIMRRLRTKHPVIVEEAAGVHRIDLPLFDGKSGARVRPSRMSIAVGCISWPRKAELLARLGATVNAEEAAETAASVLRDVLRGIGQTMGENEGPRILLMHAMVRGSVTSTGQPLVGCDMEIGLDDLGLAVADFTAIGHIHKGQDWMWNERPIVYPGSPRRTAYGELESKGYVIVEFDEAVCGCSQGYARGACPVCNNRGGVSWERIEAPATPMLLVETVFVRGEAFALETPVGYVELDGGRDEAIVGAEVRFRYRVNSDQRELAAVKAKEFRDRMLVAGAAAVKVEEIVTPTTRARAPEIGAARTIEDKLVAFWRAKKIALDDERSGRLMHMLAQLQSEAA